MAAVLSYLKWPLLPSIIPQHFAIYNRSFVLLCLVAARALTSAEEKIRPEAVRNRYRAIHIEKATFSLVFSGLGLKAVVDCARGTTRSTFFSCLPFCLRYNN